MGTAWAISEVVEFPIFCKEKQCEAIDTQNTQIHQPQRVIGKVRGKQINWETRGWECKLLLWKALLPIQVQKENTKNPSTAATAKEKNTVREGAAERPCL